MKGTTHSQKEQHGARIHPFSVINNWKDSQTVLKTKNRRIKFYGIINKNKLILLVNKFPLVSPKHWRGLMTQYSNNKGHLLQNTV